MDEKRNELVRKKKARPLAQVRTRASGKPPRDLRRALSGGRRIIAELKRRSPGVESFPQGGSTGSLAAIYERHGAAAVSVVTDEANFGTSLSDAQTVRNQVTVPVLVKDFFFDPYQIYEARSFGADAVLLISRIVGVEELGSLLALSRELGMEAIVEVHSVEDLGKASRAGAAIVGINNRDLETLDVSLDTTRRLIAHVGDDILVVSESGIRARHEIEELSTLGVDAFLIGGALLDSGDPGSVLDTLLGKE
jgi:indole-3-glycerol phosphate synthase